MQTSTREITEVYWKSGQGVHRDVLANFPAGVGAVGGYFVSGENTQHAICGNHDGKLVELYW